MRTMKKTYADENMISQQRGMWELDKRSLESLVRFYRKTKLALPNATNPFNIRDGKYLLIALTEAINDRVTGEIPAPKEI